MKLAEVRPLIDELVDSATYPADAGVAARREQTRLALETAFVAGVRSGLKFTSNAKFAEVFGGKRRDK